NVEYASQQNNTPAAPSARGANQWTVRRAASLVVKTNVTKAARNSPRPIRPLSYRTLKKTLSTVVYHGRIVRPSDVAENVPRPPSQVPGPHARSISRGPALTAACRRLMPSAEDSSACVGGGAATAPTGSGRPVGADARESTSLGASSSVVFDPAVRPNR